jgi:hypothetical protein
MAGLAPHVEGVALILHSDRSRDAPVVNGVGVYACRWSTMNNRRPRLEVRVEEINPVGILSTCLAEAV